MSSEVDHYTFLGLEPTASAAAISRALDIASSHVSHLSEADGAAARASKQRLQQIREDLLTDEARRASYDASLRVPTAARLSRRSRVVVVLILTAMLTLTFGYASGKLSAGAIGPLGNLPSPVPTPNITATAVAVEARIGVLLRRNDRDRWVSLRCVCSGRLRGTEDRAALASDLAQISRLRRARQWEMVTPQLWHLHWVHVSDSDHAAAQVTASDRSIRYAAGAPWIAETRSYWQELALVHEHTGWRVVGRHTHTLSRSQRSLVPLPALSVRAAYLVDDSTRRDLYAFHADTPGYVGSTAKMLTALVALQHVRLTSVVTVPPDALVGGTTANLVAGERMRVRDLFYGMLLPSGNDAAVTLADAAAGSTPAFAVWMNQKASQLGLRFSHFVVPHGMDVPGQYSTARDLTRIAHALLAQPFLAQVVRTTVYNTRSADGIYYHHWVNLNQLLGTYPGTIGVKTGHTPGAGGCLVSAAVRHGHRLMAVVLGDTINGRFSDSKRLLDYGWRVLGYG